MKIYINFTHIYLAWLAQTPTSLDIWELFWGTYTRTHSRLTSWLGYYKNDDQLTSPDESKSVESEAEQLQFLLGSVW